MSEATLADHLRNQYEDIRELYDAAKLNENAAQMEKLSKVMSGMVKQIKEQELHEKETIKRDEMRRLVNLIAIANAKAIRRHVADQEVAVLIIEAIRYEITQMVEDKNL